ncbi:MAG: hypothetical protein AYK23_01490 [Candidatus Proteinoplasmatales archaeon SG8-5]|nr:MAG: hypothetical protein AYK23_01490 [Candidatus Proteinoplasmatales archaeon SG8-5]
MTKIIGVCGIVCTECPAYKATQADDDGLRAKTATEWSQAYGADIKPEHINCDGCTTPGRKIHHCSECEMRACGIAKGLENCGKCAEYACQKLEEFFKMVPEAKETLDDERVST